MNRQKGASKRRVNLCCETRELREPCLRGEKVYTDGAVEKLEGVFIKRTVLNSPMDEGVSLFGLGIVGRQIVIGGLTLDKLFYQLKE
jgi:hypothetical protein